MLRIDWTFQGGIAQRLHLHDGVIQHDAAIEQITGEIQNDCRDGGRNNVVNIASGSAQCSRSSGFASVPVECEGAAQYQSKKRQCVIAHPINEVVERVGRSAAVASSKHLAHRLVCFFIRPRP